MILKIITQLTKIVFVSFLIFCLVIYFLQEKLLFFPEKLAKNHSFNFGSAFEELSIKTTDGYHLNAVLFKADSSKGLIVYLHGNAGSIDSWGEVAKTYTDLHYDVCLYDYRGYGKSEGKISSEKQLYQDAQAVYDQMKSQYKEEQIIVLGYSIGTGMATYLAANNHPQLLILQAPYYSMIDLAKKKFPLAPSFLLKYKLENNLRIKECKMPVLVFHGTMDEVIYYESSKKLQTLFKNEDRLITLEGETHNGITANIEYRARIKTALDSLKSF